MKLVITRLLVNKKLFRHRIYPFHWVLIHLSCSSLLCKTSLGQQKSVEPPLVVLYLMVKGPTLSTARVEIHNGGSDTPIMNMARFG